jgi:hypothetical protein
MEGKRSPTGMMLQGGTSGLAGYPRIPAGNCPNKPGRLCEREGALYLFTSMPPSLPLSRRNSGSLY